MSKFNRLRSHIPAIYQPTVNKFVRGILEAWGTSDDDVQKALEATKDQLFVETASQQYLDRLGSNVGVERPSAIGMSDVDFRGLVPALSFAPKQVREVMWDLLEVFYKAEAVFANFTSTVDEPYALADGDTLTFIIDRTKEVNITFKSTDFLDITQATAAETANAINKQTVGFGVISEEFNDGVAKKRFVRVRTVTPGPQGEIKIGGGTAQNKLKFPLVVNTAQDVGTQWDLDIVTGDTVRLERTGVGPNPIIAQVSVGDLVILSGPFNSLNRASFIVTDVVTNAVVDGITPGKKFTGSYVEYKDAQAFPELITQTGALDVAFYTPKRFDINAFPRPAVLYEVNHKEIVVILPSTATVIGRDLRGSAHLHPNIELKSGLFNDVTGIEFLQSDVIRGANAMYLNTGSGDFVEGETITGGLSFATASVYKIVSNTTSDTILFLVNVVGGFIFGETVTGSVSGATRNFSTVISTTGATAEIDAVLTKDRKYAIGNQSGLFTLGEGLVGRSVMRLEYLDSTLEEGETVTSANAMHLIPPYIGNFLIGETVTGGTSFASATVVDVIRNKHGGITTLQIGSIVGIFSPSELVTGGTSTAFAQLDEVVLVSGATAKIREMGGYTVDGSVALLKNETKAFRNREIVIGSTSGSKGVLGIVDSALATYESTEDDAAYVSPYVYDSSASFVAGTPSTTLNQVVNAGSPLTLLSVNSLPSDFPNEPGYFILDFGTSNEEGPIKYFARPNANTLIIDPSHVFTKTHSSGSNVRLIRSLEATQVAFDGTDYAAYVTGLAEARTILQNLVRKVVAAGIVVRFIITFPEYAFECYNTNAVV